MRLDRCPVSGSSTLAIGAALALSLLLSSSPSRLPQSAVPAFNGSTLAGWHIQGPADWRVKHGEIVGSINAGGAGGWLVLDHGYEDFMVRLSFRCRDCESGVLFRATKTSDGTSGTYFSFAGPNAATVYKLGVNAQGQEAERTTLGIPQDQNNQPARITLKPDGWNQAEIFVRGDAVVGTFNGFRLRAFAFAGKTSGEASRYGLLALHVSGRSGAEVRIKNLSIKDLTERAVLPTEVTETPFRERKLTDLFYSEGIAAGDLNHDGVQDVVAGPFYYLGPDYKVAREIYHSTTFSPNTPPYTDSFLNYVYDFNGDGWPDVLKVNFEGARLYINPRGETRHWDEYKVVGPIAAETTEFGDIDGDGRPELLMSQGVGANNQISYAKPDWSDPIKSWTLHLVSEKGNWGHHGTGYGDVNGDGRMDILQASGWWEQPPPGTDSLWKFHAAPFGGGDWAEMARPWGGGADMFVYDVNGDGLPDVITSLAAHGWGLAWFEQKRDAQGTISWQRHMIMGNPSEPPDDREKWEETDKSVAFSELHALALADVDGDGLKDIITGKRWWSHGDGYGVPDAQSPAVLYWFKLVRKPGGRVEFVPHLINNNSGVGTQILTTDMNGDGKVDILTSARKGAFIFFNKY